MLRSRASNHDARLGPKPTNSDTHSEVHMSSLTTLGFIHTAISLVAVLSGFIAVVKERGITWTDRAGRIYIVTTLLTCLTAFGIFQHGGFTKAHGLSIVTLLVLGFAFFADRLSQSSTRAHYAAPVAYSTTLFLHMIPGVTETFTRLPLGAPVFNNPEDPTLQQVIGVLLVVYTLGVMLQLWRLRRSSRSTGRSITAA